MTASEGAPSTFEGFWRLGYTRLVPIVPPDAQLSENSSLFKRKDARGKAVGVRRQDGLWSGFDWLPHEADEQDLLRWQGMGAGVGIKTGRGLIAIDADTLVEDHAATIKRTVEEHFGNLPIRVGRYPKALYVLRTSEPMRYTRIEFGELDDKGRLKDRVEVLSDGRQFVAHGIHPTTREPYRWPRGLVPLDALPTVPPAAVTAFLEALRRVLPAARPLITEGSSVEIDQAALRGSMEHVRRAVEAIPNTSDSFPTRESYRDFGYAIKAALPDDPSAAFDIFSAWCARWQEGENDPEVVEADWRRMKGPYRRGAGWLYELAEQHAPEKFSRAEAWFEPIAESINPFAEIELNALKTADAPDYYEVLRIDDILSRPPPKYLVDRHFPEVGMGFLYSEPGIGKSFIALDVGLHIAYGREDWHGDRIHAANGVVLYIASEGSYGFRNRIHAWLKRHEVTARTDRFLMIEKTIDFMDAEDVGRLLRTVREVVKARPALVVVDTVSRAMPGSDENLQKDMTLFVKACDRVRDAFRCAVLGVHHAGKNGDMRGSTVLRGAGDFVFRLSRKPGSSIGRVTCEKQKDGPDGWSEAYRFDQVELGGGETSLVPSRCEQTIGPDVALTPELSAEVLAALGKAWDVGQPWGRTYHAGERMAARRMVADHGFEMSKAEDVLSFWLQTGVVVEDILSKKAKSKGLRLASAADKLSGADAGVFQ
ncbi:MAG: AAA family ATPase [Parvibaculaceae bacterium]